MRLSIDSRKVGDGGVRVFFIEEWILLWGYNNFYYYRGIKIIVGYINFYLY